jgi:hypothetical protein
MKTNAAPHREIRSRILSTILAIAALAILIPAGTARADLVFDNISNFENGDPDANIAATGSVPNTFMGEAYELNPGTTEITGFDVFPVNLSGTDYTDLQINIYVWGSVNTTGTVNAATPAFSNLLATYTLTASGGFPTGFFFPFEGATPGVDPGITLATPLQIPSTLVGITFNYQGSTDNGDTFNSANDLESLIVFGTPASEGSLVFSGYYRNANSEMDGNFISSLRTLGNTDESLAMRIFGDSGLEVVPEPSTVFTALAACGVCVSFALSRFRRRASA